MTAELGRIIVYMGTKVERPDPAINHDIWDFADPLFEDLEESHVPALTRTSLSIMDLFESTSQRSKLDIILAAGPKRGRFSQFSEDDLAKEASFEIILEAGSAEDPVVTSQRVQESYVNRLSSCGLQFESVRYGHNGRPEESFTR